MHSKNLTRSQFYVYTAQMMDVQEISTATHVNASEVFRCLLAKGLEVYRASGKL